MKPVRLSYVGATYLDRTYALATGEVVPDGIDLSYSSTNDIPGLFRRVARDADLDAAEMSLSTYFMMLDRGDDRFTAIPVFPSRSFRHGFIFVYSGAGIAGPKDLVGKHIGVPEYQITAALWIRAILSHEFGVHPEQMHWWYGAQHAPGYEERYPQRAPAGVSLKQIPDDQYLAGMLEVGELDALVTADIPGPFREGSTAIRRLFQDYEAMERDWYARTSFFPIMHVVVVNRAVYEAHPWIAVALLEAFGEAKRRGLDRLRYLGALAVSLPWLSSSLDELDLMFGGDPFTYGFERNRAILQAMTEYSFEQGLTSRKLDPEELFASETLNHDCV